MEHAHWIDRSFSWPGVTLTRPALLLMVVLVTLGGWTLLHRVGTPAAAHSKQAPLQPRSATSVLVLNGNGLNGVAGALANRLLSHRYGSAFATDAQVTTYARSLVLFRPGWQGEAKRLAKDAHIGTVAPLDGHLTGADAGYPLVLVLGR